ncbi:uncharacterized protein N7500_002562 [Penicillium coprophilum]|uniref:uncharacterized protein n=1 Tax=Penicillium coprophilum TaxID=36646 RepID=UPI0023929286|nr:uncharacterized protein N7500_002562 [Penicillium coprophilum]KAJ5169779.1 hypothetical protein N7500_002562 [Penicillium coprophilum]
MPMGLVGNVDHVAGFHISSPIDQEVTRMCEIDESITIGLFPSKKKASQQSRDDCVLAIQAQKLAKDLALAAIHCPSQDVPIDLETIVWFAHLCYVNLAPLVLFDSLSLDLFLLFPTTPSFDHSAQSPPLGTAPLHTSKIPSVPKSPTFNRGLIQ